LESASASVTADGGDENAHETTDILLPALWGDSHTLGIPVLLDKRNNGNGGKMSFPKWIVGGLSTIITAAIIGYGAWAWNAHASICSHDTRIELQNTELIKHELKNDIQFTDLSKKMDRLLDKVGDIQCDVATMKGRVR
jgi:hypothetical protein